MKFLLAITILFVATSAVCGQSANMQPSQCSLKLSQSPAVRGIKLEMKLGDVLAMFPGSREDQIVKNNIVSDESFPRFGVVNVGVAPTKYARERFKDIESMYFTFIDEQLVEYHVQYSRPPWPKLDDFVDKVAEALNLPPAQNWASDAPYRKTLDCNGFRIQASTADGRGALKVRTGDDPSQIQRQRRAAAEAQARREFRP